MHKIVFMLALSSLVVGCNSTGEARDETTGFKYRHTGGELWKQLRSEVLEVWRIDSEDRRVGEITTAWDVRLHPMTRFGRRHRLKITLDGTDEEGYTVLASQETEMNANQGNPLVASEAEWEQVNADGALAQRFLFKFHRRINPPKSWREVR
jgi:uncharacterized lipoprotein